MSFIGLSLTGNCLLNLLASRLSHRLRRVYGMLNWLEEKKKEKKKELNLNNMILNMDGKKKKTQPQYCPVIDETSVCVSGVKVSMATDIY